MTSFSNQKRLRFVITLGTGKFGGSENDQIRLEGFRATVSIDKAGGLQMGTLKARIYGVRASDMNSITTLQWKPGWAIKNTVEVYAIDGKTDTLVFAGNIVNAFADYQSAPDVFLQVTAQAAFFAGLSAVPPRSFRGQIDVATVMRQIADDLGFAFEDGGVDVKMHDVYLQNTGLEQARELARAAGIWLYIDDKTLAITPPNGPRKAIIPVIGPKSGLIGYPTFDGVGVSFACIFNPAIVFGGSVKLDTDLPQAAGEWIVTSIALSLDCERPGGAWTQIVRGNANGLAVVR